MARTTQVLRSHGIGNQLVIGKWRETARCLGGREVLVNLYSYSRQKFQAFALGEPIGFEVGEAGFGSTRAGDGDQITLGIDETFGVGLEAGAESAADPIPVVGLFAARLLVTKAARMAVRAGSAVVLTMTNRPAFAWPVFLMRRKSSLWLMLCFLGKRMGVVFRRGRVKGIGATGVTRSIYLPCCVM